MPPPPKHRRVPPSAIAAFVRHDEVDALLEPFVPDPKDRHWVVRCMLDEGPAHHRGANYVLLSLMGEVLSRLPAPSPTRRVHDREARVPIRVHPHRHRDGPDEDAFFPMALPMGPLDLLAPPDGRQQAAMVDCLTDGPPQHALANAAMMQLLAAMLERLAEPGDGARDRLPGERGQGEP